MSRVRLAWIILAWACLQASPAMACRYNVRDTGFVDLGTEPYHFYAFYGRRTPADLVSALREVSISALGGSNIAVDIVNVDEEKEHPGLKYLTPEAARSLPVALLVSPDGPSLPLALFNQATPLREGLAAALRALVTSPTREAIVQAVSEAFAAVLLIEGESLEANRRARQAIGDSLEEIRNQMKLMPKAVARTPVMVVLDAASLEREHILLWSLGLDTKKAKIPRAAVLYGRARWVGPLMKGDEITARNLSGLLAILGADCECGLDISGTQGTRLPVRWNEAWHASIAKALGFDPESPMVKLEVGRIIGRRGSAPAAAMGYQELSLEPAATGQLAVDASVKGSTVDSANPPGRNRAATPPVLAESVPILRVSLLVVVGLAIFVFAAGLIILWRSKKRKTE